MTLKWTLKLPLFWEIKMSKFIRSYLNKRFWICRMKNRKILLPFVTDEQKLLEEVRHSGVTGSPYLKKNWRSAGSHDQQTRVRVEKFNKTLANAQLMPDAYKHLTRPPTNSKWWQLSQGLKSKSMMLQQATSTKGTLTVFFLIFIKISYLHCLRIWGAILYLSFVR